MNCWFCVFHFQGQRDGGCQQELHGRDAEGVEAEPAPPPQFRKFSWSMLNMVSGASNNNPISNVTIHIEGKLLEVTDKKAMFMTIYP